MAEYIPIKFPGWRYGPNGEAEIFQKEEDVPEGWTDNPNDFKKAETEHLSDSPEGDLLHDELKAKPFPELRNMAKDLGIEIKIGTKKTDLVDLITAKLTEA